MPRHSIGAERAEVGKNNRRTILHLLSEYPGITRREIAKLLNLNESTIGRHLKDIKKVWRPNYDSLTQRKKDVRPRSKVSDM